MYKLSRSLLSLLAAPLFTGLALLPLTPANSVTFQPKGTPEKTAGGSSRGICLNAGVTSSQPTAPTPPIAALIPTTNGELTAAAYPTVLVKISESASMQAEFTVWDENLNGIYQTTMPMGNQAGIVSFKLPNAASPLAIGKRYKWSVAMICNPANRQQDVVVQGWLQRGEISASLSSQLNAADPLKQAKLYAQNGFWYDTLATLAELRRSHPGDPGIAAEWQELLQSVGLAELSQVPLVNCCQAPN